MNALTYAIDMEHDGERYYREQAEINKNNVLHNLCMMLAEDEKNHALILTNKMNSMDYELKDTEIRSEFSNLFKNAGEIKIEGKILPSELDFYRIASNMENNSIKLYQDLLSKAEGKQEKELYEFLIRQEKEHFGFLEELSSMLRNSEEWVESAEFGIRKEY